jgi:hypothetical protein
MQRTETAGTALRGLHIDETIPAAKDAGKCLRNVLKMFKRMQDVFQLKRISHGGLL